MRCRLAILSSLLLAGSALLLDYLAAAEHAAPSAKLSAKVDDVQFADAAGKKFAIGDLQGKKATVVVFLSFDCPVCTSYAEPLSDMAAAYAKRGVKFVAVSTGDDEDAAAAERHAKQYKITFPCFADPAGKVAEAFGADITPEVFVLDASNVVLRHRGRIDDAYYARLKRQPGHYAAGFAARLSMNCWPASRREHTGHEGGRLQLAARNAAGRQARRPTASRSITTCCQSCKTNCQQCHRPGEVGPFSADDLQTCGRLGRRRQGVHGDAQDAAVEAGEGSAFHNERRLSDRESPPWPPGSTAACRPATPSDAPPAAAFTDGWQLGQPDLILTPKEISCLDASGRDLFRCFVAADESERRQIRHGHRGAAGQPADRPPHAQLHRPTSTRAASWKSRSKRPRKKDLPSIRSRPRLHGRHGRRLHASARGLGGWAPGHLARAMPEGYGLLSAQGGRRGDAGPLSSRRAGGKGPLVDRPLFRQEQSGARSGSRAA